MLTPWNIHPSFWCSLLTLRTRHIPTHNHLHPQHHYTHWVQHILHTHIWSHTGCTLLSLSPRVRVCVCVRVPACMCVQTQGFLSSPLRALEVLSPWKQGEEEGGKDVDFLTPSVPRDTNCQQLCTFVCLCFVCMRVTWMGILHV